MKKILMAILGAILFATGTANAITTTYVVPVECWSDAGCASILISNVCNGTIVSISCSQVKTPSQTRSCYIGSTGTCGQEINLSGAYVGDFCQDVTGYDALVTCTR
jgi:hypothetical protein